MGGTKWMNSTNLFFVERMVPPLRSRQNLPTPSSLRSFLALPEIHPFAMPAFQVTRALFWHT